MCVGERPHQLPLLRAVPKAARGREVGRQGREGEGEGGSRGDTEVSWSAVEAYATSSLRRKILCSHGTGIKDDA